MQLMKITCCTLTFKCSPIICCTNSTIVTRISWFTWANFNLFKIWRNNSNRIFYDNLLIIVSIVLDSLVSHLTPVHPISSYLFNFKNQVI